MGHHGVAAFRHDGTCHDANTVATRDCTVKRSSSISCADHAQRHRLILDGATVECIAIHRRIIMRRYIDERDYVIGEHPTDCRFERQRFCFGERANETANDLAGQRDPQMVAVIARQATGKFGQTG